MNEKVDDKALQTAYREQYPYQPFLEAMRPLTGKWKVEIMWALAQRTHRFGELRRALPGITQHMLTVQLRELEADGLVKRTAYEEKPPRVEYEITEAAHGLRPVFEALIAWSKQYGPMSRN
ncbi:HxlR family transcriptional regulator [Pseudaminobacter salicylatoxidans]|uniref:HxlR family transcriptional regulator n=2 Tax=Pseudaminobacter salicylatoxidans TaxID=93369 RepID=A0A316C2V1_PSESE|nr:HxlR family transcriptional regulator [Pseudaminobacter salicylatoxidans]